MSDTYQPGDIGETVDIQIKGAVVREIEYAWGSDNPTQITVEFGDDDRSKASRACIALPLQPSVTITRSAPMPQPGEVWTGVRSLLGADIDDADMWITVHGVYTQHGSLVFRLADLDFAGAVRKYPPPDAAPDAHDQALILAILGERVGAIPSGNTDTDEARALYRKLAPAPVPVATDEGKAGMLRRFEDDYITTRDIWTETAPGSDMYTNERGIGPLPVAEIKANYGWRRSLPPISAADAGEVRR